MRMNKNMHRRVSVIGITFCVVSLIPIAMGALIGISRHSIPGFIGPASIGFIFLIIGIVMTICTGSKQKKADRIMSEGMLIGAEITDIQRNMLIQINHNHPWIVTMKYVDEYTGEEREFVSKNIPFKVYKEIGDNAQIYVMRDGSGDYFIDDSQFTIRSRV